MCGIVGYYGGQWSTGHSGAERQLNLMAASLAHRGPDSDGTWVDVNNTIGFGHQRLAVIDISATGHQPMISKNGRYVIVFNGEIYNHEILRSELKFADNTIEWRGTCDTETLLAYIQRWGLQSTLNKVEGMFAIALWDRETKELSLVRDRMGEKPLYYGWQNQVFLFGSELKAFKAHPAFLGEVNRDALSVFLRYNYLPEEYSIYKGIKKLPAGTILKLELGSKQLSTQELPEPVPYWSLYDVVRNGNKDSFTGDDTEAVEILDKLIRDAVLKQMISDVPLGAFLSGGVDSSTIVAMMQRQSTRPVKTFSIGFHEKGYNEAEYAKRVAAHLGTEHTELYVSQEEVMNVIPRLPKLYDEPFSDSSQIPTFLISQLAREHVTVSLSGDAGDELFAGYNRYNAAVKLTKKFHLLPFSFRLKLAQLLSYAPVSVWSLLGNISQIDQSPEKMRKVIGILKAENIEEVYKQLVSHWENPAQVVIGASEPLTKLTDQDNWPELSDFESCMMYLDSITYLPDDILVKLDRAAMGVSLETRVPFLDQRVVEFAWRLPLSMKIRNGQSKWILRQVLHKYVPKELINRPKMGFGLPIDSYLRGSLRDWAEDLLDESRLRQEGFFHSGKIRKKWDEHLSGRRNWQYHLWDILMFQAWLEEETKYG